jgi:RimJ/RimL family protein N-acetyltransferase
VRSQRVAEQAGYELEATLRNYAVAADGELRDTLVFVRLEPPEIK